MIEKLDVTSSKAIEYFKEQLYLAEKLLSYNLHFLSMEEGEIYSFVPHGTKEEVLYDFYGGSLYPLDTNARAFNPTLIPVQNEAKPVLIDMISEYLRHNNNCCVFEEPVATPDDAWVATSDIDYVRVQKEMFYFFDEENNDKNKLEKALVTSSNYYFLCVLGSLEKEKRALFTPGKEIPTTILEEFAKTPYAVIVKAYDGEGYLIWERKTANT
jgi:hypothetical protein